MYSYIYTYLNSPESTSIKLLATKTTATHDRNLYTHNNMYADTNMTISHKNKIWNDCTFNFECIVLNNKTYVKLGILGRGGSAIVYKAVCPDNGCIYAIKTMKSNNNNDKDILLNLNSEIAIMQLLQITSKTAINTNCTKTQQSIINQNNQNIQTNKYVIGLIDYHIDETTENSFIIMEYGETDLSQMLTEMRTHLKLSTTPVHTG